MPPCSAPARLRTCTPAGLEELDLSGNKFIRLPPMLAAATRLRRLTLYGNRELGVTRDDVDSILAPLAQLRHLAMDWRQLESPAVMAHLFKRMPQLAPPDRW